MASNYRTNIIKLFTFLGGIYFVVHFFTPEILTGIGIIKFHDDITMGFGVIGMSAIGLGLINIFYVHGSRIMFLKSDWQYSATLVCGLLLMMTVAALDWREALIVNDKRARLQMLSDFALAIKTDKEKHEGSVPVYEVRVEKLRTALEQEVAHVLVNGSSKEIGEQINTVLISSKSEPIELETLSAQLAELSTAVGQYAILESEKTAAHKSYQFLFDGLFTPLSAAMFSLLSVYIAAAAFRAFRIRSFEASLMMVTAVLVMLGQTSFGTAIYEGMPAIRQWLMEVPNSAAFRAIKIGAAIAGLVMAVRVWLSIGSEEVK